MQEESELMRGRECLVADNRLNQVKPVRRGKTARVSSMAKVSGSAFIEKKRSSALSIELLVVQAASETAHR